MRAPHSRRRTAATLAALAVLVVLSAASQASGDMRKPRSAKVSLLYVVNAGRGMLTPQAGHPGRFTLTLKHLEGRAVWFSDRPTRRSGTFPASGIAAAWKGFGFTAAPPNAAIDYTDPTRGFGRTAILELTHPRYRPGALSFSVRILDPGAITSGNLAAHARRADSIPAHILANPTLFIDDTTAPIVSGCIIQPFTDCPPTIVFGLATAGVNLSGVNLSGADLLGAELIGANFQGSNLAGANLSQANLIGADFNYAKLSGANLFDSNLNTDTFVHANLTGATLVAATAWYATFRFATVDLGTILNAELCSTTLPDGSVLSADCNGSPSPSF